MQVSNTYIASFVPEIPTAVSVTILLYFDQDTYTYLLLYAPVLIKIPTHTYCCMRRFLRRFLRGCVAVCAVASPSHRRIASAPHRVTAQNAGDFIKITFASGAADSLHAD